MSIIRITNEKYEPLIKKHRKMMQVSNELLQKSQKLMQQSNELMQHSTESLKNVLVFCKSLMDELKEDGVGVHERDQTRQV